MEMPIDAPLTAAQPTRREVKMTLPTLTVGVTALVAATVVTTRSITSPSAPVVQKFASPVGLAGRARPLHAKFGIPASQQKNGPAYVPTVSGPFGEETGALPPVGYLDPLGFGKKASAARLRWFREAELKHGRIAMLAAVGFLVNENPDLRDAFFPSHPEWAGNDGLASTSLTSHDADLFWYTFVAGCGVIEVDMFNKMDNVLDWKFKPDYAVGDLGWDPLNLTPKDAAGFNEKRTKELQNGRLAMLAIAGFNAQEMTDGKPIWPIHGIGSSASAADVDAHISKGLDLVKEVGDMMSTTGLGALESSHLVH